MKTTIFTIILIPVVLLLGYFLVASVKTPIDQTAAINSTEALIIKKLEIIRDLQLAYISQKGKYTSNWDELIKFGNTGKFFIINIKEQDLGNGKVKRTVDTLGTVPVKDSLTNKHKNNKNIEEVYRKMYVDILNNLDKLPLVPNGNGKKFELYTGVIEKNGYQVEVFEAKDAYPMNPARGGNFEAKDRIHVDTLVNQLQSKLDKIKKNIRIIDAKLSIIFKEVGVSQLQGNLLINDKLIKDAPVTQQTALLDTLKSAKEKIKSKVEALKPLKEKLEVYSEEVALLEKRIKVYKEKPLKVGSREDASTGGNWE